MNYQNGQFAPDDDPGGKPIPDHLATWWDGLQDEHRATFRGPRWAGPNINHRLKVSLAVAKAMHDGLSVDDAVGLCLFPDGLGSWPFHAALVRDLWKERLAELAEHEAKKAAADPLAALGIWNAGTDDYSTVPPREWLLGTTFCRGFLSQILADGGIGKTSLRITQIASCTTGRNLTGEHVHRRSRWLILSFEDGKNELRRRVYAAMLKHGIRPADLNGWLYLAAPKGLKLAGIVNGAPVAAELEGFIRGAITALQLDGICLDPFIKTHGMNENDNNAIDFVCGLLTEIGIELNIAVDLPHHTTKGMMQAGNADKGRGASSGKDAARLVYTLAPMTTEEAGLFGQSESERRSLVRYDSGKVNIAPPAAETKWFKMIGMPLDNGTPAYPAGDHVQAIEVWHPPKLLAGMDAALLNLILDDIAAGMETGQRYSNAGAAEERAGWRVVQKHVPQKTEKECREVISLWMKSKVLFNEKYDDPVRRECIPGLQVNHVLRPS